MSGECPAGERLLAYLEGAADEEETASVERHLADCRSCTLLAERMKRSLDILRDLGERRRRGDECPQWASVIAYAERHLDDDEAAGTLRHIEECPDCLGFLADLWSDEGCTVPASARAVEDRVFSTLAAEGRTAVVRWVDGAATLVRGFARALDEATRSAGVNLVPAPAPMRGAKPLRLGWSGPGGLGLECEIREAAGGPTVLGRLSAAGSTLRAASAMLRSAGSTRGPESLDAAGRFGPWPLSPGTNRLILSGAGLPEGGVDLSIELIE